MSDALGRRWRALRLLLTAGLSITSGLPQSGPTALGLERVVESRIGDGETHEYLVALQAGEYAHLTVDQKSVNVAISCLGPDGKQVFTEDRSGIGHIEDVEWIGGAQGAYRLRLAPSEPRARKGDYTITLRVVEPATERHRKRIAAARAEGDAVALHRQGTPTAITQAIARMAEALRGWQASGDQAQEAYALLTLSALSIETGDSVMAHDYANRSLGAARISEDPRAVGRAFDGLGEALNNFGDKKKAIGYYEQALSLLRMAGDRADEGHTLSNLAVALAGTGEKARAVALFEEAIQIFRALQDRSMLAEVSGNLGVTYDSMGEYQRALDCHQNGLLWLQELGNHSDEAIAWNNIGSAYSGLGEYQKALDAYSSALEINRSLGKRWNEAVNRNNIGWIYSSLGDLPRALTFYQEALRILRDVKDQRRVAITLNNIAEIYTELGDFRKAVELHVEALPLRREVGDTDGEANSLSNLGRSYAKLGEREKARDHYVRALAIHRNSGNRYMMARTLRNLGELERETGNFSAASRRLDEARETSFAIHDGTGEAQALAYLACVERDRSEWFSAIERADQALAALEASRLRVTSPSLRASFFASARETLQLKIEVLMRMHAEQPAGGFDAAALQASERGRARSLLEMLGETGLEIRQGVDTSLLDRERDLERLISEKGQRQESLLSAKHTEAEVAVTENELNGLMVELEQLQSKIRESSPRYAALTQPAPLNLQQIQAQVLDPDTILLEYSLGARKSFLWAVTPESIHSFELPPQAEIESAAQRLRELLTARTQTLPKETPAARASRIADADSAYVSSAAVVSRMLLGPAGALIRDKRLLIVGDGMLPYLPFAALTEPANDDSSGAAPVLLVVNHEIVTAPSASVVDLLRTEAVGRQPAAGAVLVLADPVFSAADPRVQPRKNPVREAAIESEFPRLRFSRTEADEIARVAPARTVEALDFAASRDTAGRDLERFRVVHFATHSVIDNRRPDLSGVVLSLVDRSGRQKNGYLRLYDIYNLRLAADLVVLSACQTAMGQEVKGEGLMSLTRGFFYAGAPRVVATLWNIDDRSTVAMMKRFYELMMVRGEQPAAALRQAQLAMIAERRWEAPYYWAAFTLQGEWR